MTLNLSQSKQVVTNFFYKLVANSRNLDALTVYIRYNLMHSVT